MTEIRMRFQSPSVHTVYEAVATADGKRRILRDNLGTIAAVRGGWELKVDGVTTTHATQPDALAHAAAVLTD